MQDEPTGPGETGAPTTPPDGALSGTKAVEATVADPNTAEAPLGELPATPTLGPGDPVPVLQPVMTPGRLAPAVRLLGAAVLGAVAVLALMAVTGNLRGPKAETGAGASTTGDFVIDGATVGIPGAPLTIEIWADYQCPYCGLFTHGLEGTLLREYAATGRATLKFRDFAFLGQESIDAAVAARCAGRQGAYWPYHDLLYASQQGENQGAFAQANLLKLAQFGGLDAGAFASCLADPTLAGEVATETATGRGLGISSTPTIRIVGPLTERTLKGLTPLKMLLDEIAAVEAGRSATDGTTGEGGAGSEASPSASPAQ